MKSMLCSKCHEPIDEHRVGNYRYCLSCHSANMRKNRPKHSELSVEQRLKANCRAYTKVYIKRGKLVKQPCLICGTTENIQSHHEDYTKPLDVVWLCKKHHQEHHNKINNLNTNFERNIPKTRYLD